MSSGNATAFSHAEGMRGKPGKKKWSKHKKGATPLAKLKEQCLPEGWYSNIGTRINQLRRNLVQKCKQGMVRRKAKTACAMVGGEEAKECAKANKNIQKLVPMASTRINLDNQDPALLEELRKEMEEDAEEDDGMPAIAEEGASVAASGGAPGMRSSAASKASIASKASSIAKALNTGPRKSLNEALAESMLYVQVLSAKKLTAAKLSGVSDPFVTVTAGDEDYRTGVIHGTLNPKWDGALFCFKGSGVARANMMVAFEVWSNDDFHSDDFLGQAELDLRKIPIQQQATCQCTLTLYVLMGNGQKETGDFGELSVKVWLAHVGAEAPQVLAPAGALNGHNMIDVLKKEKSLPSVVSNSLGTLYEEPCVVYVRISIDKIEGLYEKATDSYGGLGQLVEISYGGCNIAQRTACMGRKMLMENIKKLKHNTADLGSFLPISRSLGMSLGPNDSAFEQLDRPAASTFTSFKNSFTKGLFGNKAKKLQGAPTGLTLPDTINEELEYGDEEEMLNEDNGDEDEGVDRDSGFTRRSGDVRSSKGIFSDGLSSSDHTSELSSENTDNTTKPTTLHKRRQAYLYLEVEYAAQIYTSKMVRLDVQTGTASLRQDFVFGAVRPISSRPVIIGIYVTMNKEKSGRLVGMFTEDIMDLIRENARSDASSKEIGIDPKAAALHKPTVAPEYTLPLMAWPLDEPYRGFLRMHVGTADYDYRPFMYNVPLLETTPMRDEYYTQGVTHAPSLEKRSIERSENVFTKAPSAGAPGSAAKPGNEVERWLQKAQEANENGDRSVRLSASTAPAAAAIIYAQDEEEQRAEEEEKTLKRPSSFRGRLEAILSAIIAFFMSYIVCCKSWAKGQLCEVKIGDTCVLPGQTYNRQISMLKQDSFKKEKAKDDPPPIAPLPKDLGWVNQGPDCPSRPVGTLTLELERMKMSLDGVWYFTVLKCGPHWIRTALRSSECPSAYSWKMTIPIYDPSETLTVVTFYQKTQNAKSGDAIPYSRSNLHISNLTPNVAIERHLTVFKIQSPEKDEEDRQKKRKQNHHAHRANEKAAAKDAKGAHKSASKREEDKKAPPKKRHTMQVAIKLKLEYHSWKEVAEAYVRPLRPDAFYVLGLDGASEERLEKQYHSIVARWLEHSYPPLHHSIVKAVLWNRRQKFSVAQIKANWARVKNGLSLLGAMSDGYDSLVTWNNPLHSSLAMVWVIVLAWYPSLAFATFFAWVLKVVNARKHLSGQPPNRHGLDMKEEDEDEDLDAPTEGGAFASLKKQYEQAVRVALMAQNYLDDIAVVFERFHSLLSWADPAATILFAAVMAAISALMYLLGFQVLFMGVGIFLLRPPKFRDPMPAKPVALFCRLPAALSGNDNMKVNRTVISKK